MTFVPFDTRQVECRGVFRDENSCLYLDTTLTMTLNPNINAVSHKVQNNELKDGTTLRKAPESGDKSFSQHATPLTSFDPLII